MKNKSFLIIVILLLCIIFSTSAQKSYSLKGVVIDSATMKPIDYLTVNVKNSRGNFVKNTLTKNDGSFLIHKIFSGKYLVTIIGVGYHTKIINIKLSDSITDTIDLEKIYVNSQTRQLKEVQIKGAKPVITQELDRLVYDVRADPSNKGLNILEVMEKVPLLSVDADNNVQLKGSKDFKIYVDGRPSGVMSRNPIEALRVMKSISVKKIEVITTPSAGFDAEGAAGIINIVTFNNVEGYNVIFEVLHNSRRGSIGVGSAFTAKKGSFGITGYVGDYSRHFPVATFSNSRTTFLPYQAVKNEGSTRIPSGSLIPANADLSYEIDSLNLLTSSIVFSLERLNQNDLQSFDIFDQISLTNSYNSNINSHSRVGGSDVSLNYQRGFKNKKDRLLTTSYRYSTSVNDYNSNNTATGVLNYVDNQFTQKNNSGMFEQTFQLYYVRPGKKINLEAGAKLIKRDNYSDFKTENFNINGSSTNIDDLNMAKIFIAFIILIS